MSHEGYHEPYERLSEGTRELHRAIVSLIEELEAVDWYQQRADVCGDPELKAVLLHHRDEEVEHAMMNLEWIRRRDEVFDRNARTYLFSQGTRRVRQPRGRGDRNARTYLFSQGKITEVEEAATGGPHEQGTSAAAQERGAGPGAGDGTGGSLGIGSLRGR